MKVPRFAMWFLVVFLPFGFAAAQVKNTAPSNNASGSGKQKQQTARKPVQVPKLSREAIRIFLDKIEITGRVEKPQAIFIIPGRSPEVEDVRIDRSFFKEIFRKVEMPTGARKKARQVVRSDLILW